MTAARHQRARDGGRPLLPCLPLFVFGRLLVAGLAPASDDDFVHALRDRGLDRLAEAWCLQELSDSGLPPRRQAGLVGLLSEVHVGRALAAPAGEAAAHWHAADQAIVGFLEQQPKRPEFVLLRLQRALNAKTRGGAERLRALAGSTPADGAAVTLRAAARRLDVVADEVEALRLATGIHATSATQLTKAELASLATRVAIEQADCRLALAECYPAGSADRDDALLLAAETARRIVGLDLPARLLWRGRLALVESERRLGKSVAALARLDVWAKEGPPPPPDIAGRSSAERLRLLQATGDKAGAERWVATLPLSQAASPEVRFAQLESAVRKCKQARPGAERDARLAEVRSRAGSLRRDHGPLWGLRAEALAGNALAAAAIATPEEDGSIDSLVAAAEYFFRAGQPGKAIDAYDRAAGVAFRRGARGRAFELALAAAAIHQSQSNWVEAGKRFRRAALAGATHPDAPVAHRAAGVCVSQALRSERPTPAESGASPDESEALWKEYTSILTEHLATWPAAESAGECRWWLIAAHGVRRSWAEQLSALEGVEATDPRYDEAIDRRGRASAHLAEQLFAAGDDQRAKQAIVAGSAKLAAIVLRDDGDWPRVWQPTQRVAALAAARLRLRLAAADPGAADYAKKMLLAALGGSPDPSADWASKATPTLAAALACRGELDKARVYKDRYPPRTREAAAPLLDALRRRLDARSIDAEAAGALLLSVLDDLDEDDDADGAWRLPYRAAALAATGGGDGALSAARAAAAAEPDNAIAQERLARLLADRPGQADRRDALTMWRDIEQRSRGGSPRWFRARLARLELMTRLGRHDEAVKLLAITRVLHPTLGGMAKAYQDALRQEASAPEP